MDVDKHSKTWMAIEQWAHEQRHDAINRLKSVRVKNREAHVLRGQLATLEKLLGLPDEKPLPKVSRVNYTTPTDQE